MVGQALGAGRPERAARAVWLAAFYDCCVLTVVGVGADGAKFLQIPPVGGKSSKIANVHIDQFGVTRIRQRSLVMPAGPS